MTNKSTSLPEYDRDYALPRNAQNAPTDVFAPDDYDPLDADEAADLLDDAAAHGLFLEPEDNLRSRSG